MMMMPIDEMVRLVPLQRRVSLAVIMYDYSTVGIAGERRGRLPIVRIWVRNPGHSYC